MENKTIKNDGNGCRYEMAYAVEFRNVREELRALKDRVGRLETTLARGVLLLVANLAGVVTMLTRQLLSS